MTRHSGEMEWPKAKFTVPYFLVFFCSLFATLEGELGHWFSLVLLPLLGTWWFSRRENPSIRFLHVVRGLGLHWPIRNKGIVLALVLAVCFQGIQLMNGPQRRELVEALTSDGSLWIVPVAFLLVLVTAGFTEEFFFRGVLQRSLTARLKSWPWAIVLTTIAFSLYHLPYAYLNPNWASAGDLVQAIKLALINGAMGGVVLGIVFVRGGGSLVPGILLHSSINWIPAIRLLAQI